MTKSVLGLMSQIYLIFNSSQFLWDTSEKIYENDFYVSDGYLDSSNQKRDWRNFLLDIGLKDDVNWNEINISRYSSDINNRFDKDFFLPILDNSSELGIKYGNKGSWGDLFHWQITSFSVYHFSFMQYAAEYQFSKLFWNRVFQKEAELTGDEYINGSCGYWEKRICLDKECPTSYFRWTIDNLELFPTINRECRRASDVFVNSIPQINEIAGKYLPVLDYEGVVSPEWIELLKFKEQLRLDDYLMILSKIWQDSSVTEEEQKENKKRVCFIYEKLAEIFSGLHQSDKEKLFEWAVSNKLMAKNGEFYSPKELSIVTIDGFNDNHQIYKEKTDDNVIELFRQWGIRVIDSVNAEFSNSIVSMDSLRNQLNYIAPLIALVAVEKSRSRKEWHTEYNRIVNKLSEISFYETTDIRISYGNEQDVQQRSTWAEDNDFYYVGNWYKPRVLDGLVEPLCKFMNIRYAERILTVLLSDKFLEGIKYLEEKGFDITIIPEEYLNSTETPTVQPDFGNRGYNETKEDIGKKGELFVYEELKRIYKKKYSDSLVETEIGFKIGCNLEVIWCNKKEVSKANHDFRVIESGKEMYIDSKATKFSKYIEDVSLSITVSELQLMEVADKYLIARVYDAMSEEPSVEFLKLQIDNVINQN